MNRLFVAGLALAMAFLGVSLQAGTVKAATVAPIAAMSQTATQPETVKAHWRGGYGGGWHGGYGGWRGGYRGYGFRPYGYGYGYGFRPYGFYGYGGPYCRWRCGPYRCFRICD